MTARTHDHDSTDTRTISTRLLARLGVALALLVATATAGIGAAAAIPGETSTGVGLSKAAPSDSHLADTEAAPGTVIQSRVVGVNEEYVAVRVTLDDPIIEEGTYERVQNNLIVDRDAFADDGLPGLEFPRDTFAGEEEIPVESEEISPRESDSVDDDQRVADTDGLTVSDLAYLAPVDKRKAVEDGEIPVLTPVAMDFENPHEVILYFEIDEEWPKEYLSSDAAGEGLGIYMIAPGGWHALPLPQPEVAAPPPVREPDATGPILLERPESDSRPETGTDADIGSGLVTTPQDDVPQPSGPDLIRDRGNLTG